MSTTDGSTELVQLGQFEVRSAALDDAGDFLDTFTNNLVVQPAFVSDRALTVPLMGWRVVHESEATADEDAQQTLAAPHPTKVDAWVTATRISTDNDFATYRYDSDPVTPVLPKRERRAQLSLEWPLTHTPETSLGELRVVLVNTSSTVWTPTERDDFYITGVVESDADGTEVHGGGFFLYLGGSPEASSLAPGERRYLPVDVDHEFLGRLAPGKYLVMAVLVSLELNSATTVATRL